jgi:hypothetical protein
MKPLEQAQFWVVLQKIRDTDPFRHRASFHSRRSKIAPQQS